MGTGNPFHLLGGGEAAGGALEGIFYLLLTQDGGSGMVDGID